MVGQCILFHSFGGFYNLGNGHWVLSEVTGVRRAYKVERLFAKIFFQIPKYHQNSMLTHLGSV